MAIEADLCDLYVTHESEHEVFISRKEDCNPILAMGKIKRLFSEQHFFHPLVRVDPLRVTGLYLGMNFNLKGIKNIKLDRFKNMQSNIFTVKPDAEKYTLNISRTNHQ